MLYCRRFSTFALYFTIRRVQKNQDGLKLNCTHQLLVYADDDSISGGIVHTVKKNMETLVVAIKEIGLEVNADNLSSWSCLEIRVRDEVHNIKTGNSSFEKVAYFKYFCNNINE